MQKEYDTKNNKISQNVDANDILPSKMLMQHTNRNKFCCFKILYINRKSYSFSKLILNENRSPRARTTKNSTGPASDTAKSSACFKIGI